MVALLVSLKLSLLRNGLQRSVWRLVGLIVGALYALGLVAGVWIGLGALRLTSTGLTSDVTVLAFALLTAGWLLFSLLVFGVDETVDPRRFALLPVPARKLVPGLFVSGLIGIPGTATVLASCALVLTWARSPLLAVGALLAVPLGIATCFLLSRAVTAAFTSALGSRRFRDFAAVVLALVGAVLGVGFNLLGRLAGTDPDGMRGVLHSVATGLGWSPLGWAWSLPGEIAAGHLGLAALKLLLAAAFVLGLARAWTHFLDQALCSPLEAGGASKEVKQVSGIDRLFPATPAGAVAGRSLRYWRRDPRYLSSLAAVFVAPLVIVFASVASPGESSSPYAIYAPVLLALLLGSIVAQDLSYDGSAVWTHVLSGLTGRADRAGRVMSTLVVMGPILVILVVVAGAATGEWETLPKVIALSIALSLGSAGAGSFIGAVWQVPAPPPGASPFAKNSNGGGLKGFVSFGLTSASTVAVGLPTIAVVVASYWLPWLQWVAIVVAVGTGLAAMVIGIRLGGRRLDRSWPEVMTAVSLAAT